MGRDKYVRRDAVAIASMPARLLRMRPEMIGPEQQAYQHPQGRDDNCQSFLRVFCHVKRGPTLKEKPEFVHAFSHLSKARDPEVSCLILVHYRLESLRRHSASRNGCSNCRPTQEAIYEMIE